MTQRRSVPDITAKTSPVGGKRTKFRVFPGKELCSETKIGCSCLLAERIEVEHRGMLRHVLAEAVFQQQRVPPEQ